MPSVTSSVDLAAKPRSAQQTRDLLVIAVCGLLAVCAMLLQDCHRGSRAANQPSMTTDIPDFGD